MRLTDTQVRIIKARAAECFGPNAKIWLFGSRVDDKALAGDIDLYVELTEPLTDAAWRALRFNGALQQAFGAQHIDVITPRPERTAETDPRDGQAIRHRSVNDLAARLARVLELVDRQTRHLAEVTQRFFGDVEAIDREWLERQLATPEGIDRLESFGAKFSRLARHTLFRKSRRREIGGTSMPHADRNSDAVRYKDAMPRETVQVTPVGLSAL